MYQLEVRHHKRAWRNGDLEDAFELLKQENYKTKTAAKDYIESQLKGKPADQVQRYYHKGDVVSHCYWFTGNTWQHENTGEKMEEYYQYTLKKVKLR